MNDEALFGRSSDARGGGCCGGRKLPGCGTAVQYRHEQCCAVGAAVPADRERRGQADGREGAIRVSKMSETGCSPASPRRPICRFMTSGASLPRAMSDLALLR
jgi:hypothetical protein